MSTNIFERLRSERERLGSTQEDFARIAGVTRRPYVEWEKGAGPSPSATQLAAMASAGVDVLYVITGERSQGVSEVDLLPVDERLLVDAYRRCPPAARQTLMQTAALLAAGIGGLPGGPQKQVNKGAGSVMVGTHHQTGGKSGTFNYAPPSKGKK